MWELCPSLLIDQPTLLESLASNVPASALPQGHHNMDLLHCEEQPLLCLSPPAFKGDTETVIGTHHPGSWPYFDSRPSSPALRTPSEGETSPQPSLPTNPFVRLVCSPSPTDMEKAGSETRLFPYLGLTTSPLASPRGSFEDLTKTKTKVEVVATVTCSHLHSCPVVRTHRRSASLHLYPTADDVLLGPYPVSAPNSPTGRRKYLKAN